MRQNINVRDLKLSRIDILEICCGKMGQFLKLMFSCSCPKMTSVPEFGCMTY